VLIILYKKQQKEKKLKLIELRKIEEMSLFVPSFFPRSLFDMVSKQNKYQLEQNN
jgi:hypothetical protein